jgi:hypothetical protein
MRVLVHTAALPTTSIAVSWTCADDAAKIIRGTGKHLAAFLLLRPPRKCMIAVIGNVIAGLSVFGLFTATLRLSKPGKRS